jgi:hypothetical protein
MTDAEKLQALYSKIVSNPDARKLLHKAIEKAGSKGFADLEAEERVEAQVAERTKGVEQRLEEMQQRLLTKEAQERVEREREALRRKRYSKEDIEKIEDLMVKKGLSDYGDAVTLYEAQTNPLPAGNSHGLFGQRRRRTDEIDWRKEVKKATSDLRTKTDEVLDQEFDKAYETAMNNLAEMAERQQ